MTTVTILEVSSSARRKAGNVRRTPGAIPEKRDAVSNGVLKPDTHGQVFTPEKLVKEMLALRRNTGRVLEPACGSGAFARVLHASGADLVALELDREHAPAFAVVKNFFDYPETERFATIIGNPPYVGFQQIEEGTKGKLDMTFFDGRTNLFYFFIEKCVRHLGSGGELIFVVPRDFPQATAARRLNRWLFDQGSITDFREIGDQAFVGATPPCCVFRFEKGRMDRTMTDGRIFAEHDGQLLFLPAGTRGVPLSEFFTVAVGGLTGADDLFTNPNGNLEIVCSSTRKTGNAKRMLDESQAKELLHKHRETLEARKVRKFDETNWWAWGRKWRVSEAPRVYVNAKTRQANPFFTHAATAYDGSILALFPNDRAMDVEQAAAILNGIDWEALGFMSGGRFLFSQGGLERALIPDSVASQLRTAIAQTLFKLAA